MIAAAVADSLAAAGGAAGEHPFTLVGMHGPQALAQAMEFARAAQAWREFYMLAGTAAVTLVGLLFVSLSFHLDTLLHESKAHLLDAARATFRDFVFVLVMSLMFVIPTVGPVFMGMWVAGVSLMFLGVTVVNMLRAGRTQHPHGHDRFMVRRRRLSALAFVLALANAVTLMYDHSPKWLFNFVAPVCLLLGNAAGTSWDLLVQVGRLRRAEEKREG